MPIFIFNVVFFISLTSVLLQGTTLPLVARWLNVIEANKPVTTAVSEEIA
jgi:potassium/hydrogen antiporter